MQQVFSELKARNEINLKKKDTKEETYLTFSFKNKKAETHQNYGYYILKIFQKFILPLVHNI